MSVGLLRNSTHGVPVHTGIQHPPIGAGRAQAASQAPYQGDASSASHDRLRPPALGHNHPVRGAVSGRQGVVYSGL